ncbi:MAG: hypothetical protein IPL53_12060 [Ignavibacteria bacterium]|nr:hypothetical protein [Ignavibacteria bacterium]
MKRLIFLFLLFYSVAFSQPAREKYYFAGGFNFSFQNSDELNTIINNYNSNPAVTEKMGSFGFFFGPSLIVGANYEREKNYFNFEFGFGILFSGTKSAQVSQVANTRLTQDVNLKLQLVNLEGQYFIKASRMFHVGAGFALNIGAMKIFERSYNRFTSTPSYTTIDDGRFFSYVGVTPNLSFNYVPSKYFAISVRPNYFILLKNQDLAGLNSALNPGTVVNGAGDSFFSGPGVAVNLQFKVGD